MTGAVAPRDDAAPDRVRASRSSSTAAREASGIRDRLVRLMLVAVGVAPAVEAM